jgi:hypothetical protein
VGDNTYGQVGNGGTKQSNTPVGVAQENHHRKRLIAAPVCGYHTYAL